MFESTCEICMNLCGGIDDVACVIDDGKPEHETSLSKMHKHKCDDFKYDPGKARDKYLAIQNEIKKYKIVVLKALDIVNNFNSQKHREALIQLLELGEYEARCIAVNTALSYYQTDGRFCDKARDWIRANKDNTEIDSKYRIIEGYHSTLWNRIIVEFSNYDFEKSCL